MKKPPEPVSGGDDSLHCRETALPGQIPTCAIQKLAPTAYNRSAAQAHAILLYVFISFPSLPGSQSERTCSPCRIRFWTPKEVSFPEKIMPVMVRMVLSASGRIIPRLLTYRASPDTVQAFPEC